MDQSEFNNAVQRLYTQMNTSTPAVVDGKPVPYELKEFHHESRDDGTENQLLTISFELHKEALEIWIRSHEE
jgi:hypothetical protein